MNELLNTNSFEGMNKIMHAGTNE